MSGHWALSRRIATSVPARPLGVGVEAESVVHAARFRLPGARTRAASGERASDPAADDATRTATVARECATCRGDDR